MRRTLLLAAVALALAACKRAETSGTTIDAAPPPTVDVPGGNVPATPSGTAFAATEGDPREELTGRTYDVLLDGTFAYRATTAGVVVEDLSQPQTPQRLAVAELPGSVNRLALVGDVERPAATACPALPDGGTNPACGGGPPRRVLAAAAGPVGVVLYDIRDPAQPVELSRFDTPGAAMGLAATYPNLYVADGTNGVLVLDVRDPERPLALAGTDGLPPDFSAFANGPGPARPTPAVDQPAPVDADTPAPEPPASPYVRDVLLDGSRLFAASGPAGLIVYDVRDPLRVGGNLVLMPHAAIDTPGDARAVAVDGTTAYVADGPAGLQIIDLGLAEPAAGPAIVATWATRDVCRDVKIAVGRDRALFPPTAYLAVGDRGLEVLDISDSAAPQPRGRHEAQRPVNRITVGPNGLLLLSNDAAGLLVVDAADPAAIRVVFPHD
ncbi:MAG: hypothetical protein JXB32_08250 [Deltaproteobacteria bacterium]|nr:hypothetical protein [Deltaproteobacteria bacterium]